MQETKPHTLQLLETLSEQFKTYGNVINFVGHPLISINRWDDSYMIDVFTSSSKEKVLITLSADDKAVAISTSLVDTFELTHEQASAALDESVKKLIAEGVWYTEDCIKKHIAAKAEKQKADMQAKVQSIKNIVV